MVSKFERMSEALGNAEAETRALQKMQKMQQKNGHATRMAKLISVIVI